ncbi:hypothetical protein CCP3SC5AM1_1520002 [Gammaproteobacteria bacterium]
MNTVEALEDLTYVCQVTKAIKGDFNGKSGYYVSGKLRNYFVTEDRADVYDSDTGNYISVVARGGKHGDNTILAPLILALHNDISLTNNIPTLT